MSDSARSTRPGSPAGTETAVCATLARGLHRLAFVPGHTTAGELRAALAGVPDSAVCMGGSVGPDDAEVEFVEFDDPFGAVEPAGAACARGGAW